MFLLRLRDATLNQSINAPLTWRQLELMHALLVESLGSDDLPEFPSVCDADVLQVYFNAALNLQDVGERPDCEDLASFLDLLPSDPLLAKRGS